MSHTFLSNTVYPDTWSDSGGGIILVEQDALVISVGFRGLSLADGPWTVTVNGTVDGADTSPGIALLDSASTVNSTLTIGAEGAVYAGGATGYGLYVFQPTDITNSGSIEGGQ